MTRRAFSVYRSNMPPPAPILAVLSRRLAGRQLRCHALRRPSPSGPRSVLRSGEGELLSRTLGLRIGNGLSLSALQKRAAGPERPSSAATGRGHAGHALPSSCYAEAFFPAPGWRRRDASARIPARQFQFQQVVFGVPAIRPCSRYSAGPAKAQATETFIGHVRGHRTGRLLHLARAVSSDAERCARSSRPSSRPTSLAETKGRVCH